MIPIICFVVRVSIVAYICAGWGWQPALLAVIAATSFHLRPLDP